MSRSRKARRNARPAAPAAGGRAVPRSAVVLLAVVVVAGGGYWWSTGRHADAPAAAVPPAVRRAASPTPPAVVEALPAFQKLEGRWRRADGGYIIEIRSVGPGGTVDAAYFNPRPIHVGKAEATQEGAVTKLVVELSDANYPGSTYTLAYDAVTDRLVGNYFQAALGQNFDVEFGRQAPQVSGALPASRR